MVERRPVLPVEARRAVGHDALALRPADLRAEVGLGRPASGKARRARGLWSDFGRVCSKVHRKSSFADDTTSVRRPDRQNCLDAARDAQKMQSASRHWGV